MKAIEACVDVVREALVDVGMTVGSGAAGGLGVAVYDCGPLVGDAAIVIVTSSSSGELAGSLMLGSGSALDVSLASGIGGIVTVV
jgi:glycerate kinase